MSDPQGLATFLAAVHGVHVSGSGTKETSFYTAIDNLLDGIGGALKPKVRCVIEVKPPAEAVDFAAASAQVEKYWGRYRLVLVTNLRDWLLIGERDGQRVPLERYTLAANAEAFWKLASHPASAQQQRGGAFAEFLARVMLHAAPLSEPKDRAWLLASCAREAAHSAGDADRGPGHGGRVRSGGHLPGAQRLRHGTAAPAGLVQPSEDQSGARRAIGT